MPPCHPGVLRPLMVWHTGPQTRQQRVLKLSIPVTATGLSTFLSGGPHSLPLPNQRPGVEAFLHVCAPLSVPHRPPSWRSSMHWKRTLAIEIPWGSERSSNTAPINFRLPAMAQFWASLHVHVPGPMLLLKVMKRSSSANYAMCTHRPVLYPP